MIEKLMEIGERCTDEMRQNQNMTLSKEDTMDVHNASCCYLCDEQFTESNFKVRDHDHRTGNQRGPCHNKCNILHFTDRYLPIFSIISKATTHIIYEEQL